MYALDAVVAATATAAHEDEDAGGCSIDLKLASYSDTVALIVHTDLNRKLI